MGDSGYQVKPRQEEGLQQAIEGFVRCVITWGPVRSQGRTYMENCESAVISGTLTALKSGWEGINGLESSKLEVQMTGQGLWEENASSEKKLPRRDLK